MHRSIHSFDQTDVHTIYFLCAFPLMLHLSTFVYRFECAMLIISNGRVTHKMNTYRTTEPIYFHRSQVFHILFEIVHGYMRNKLNSSLIFSFFGNVSARHVHLVL